ncbi:MAG: endolytic transglycosylase MltG [Smithella sp.]
MKKKSSKIAYRAVLLLAIGIITYLALIITYSLTPIDGKKTPVTVDIPTGSSFLKITQILEDAGMIKSRILFYGRVSTRQALKSIRAGEYEFNTSMTPWAVVDKLLRGEIRTYRVTIPEDLSVKEIAARLKEYKLINEKQFFELAEDKEFLRSVGINAASVEGYLFPETYYFDRSMSTRQIMRIMVNQFWKKVTPAMLDRAGKLGFSVQEYVTLASIIGKESGNYAEKPLISAVFHNRLKRKMRLQSDPTAVYDLEKFEGAVKRSHLQRNSPYNTYVISGLPPGPIGNPWLDSLKAALYPAGINYLYFVSQGDGSHFFSSSLEIHNQASIRYWESKKKK